MNRDAEPPVFALVGNPNSGKTTLFNALTGMRQKIGNYPGVTVEKKVGECYSQHGRLLRVIDLPGAYSLIARSPDEAVLRDVLLGRRPDTPRPDCVICVIDASNLERNLYLATQVLELGLPAIVALNMMDVAAGAGTAIAVERLQIALGVPVIPCEAANRKGILELRLAMSRADLEPSGFVVPVPEAVRPGLEEVARAAARRPGTEPSPRARGEAMLLLAEQETVDLQGSLHVPPAAVEARNRWCARWRAHHFDWRRELTAARFAAVHGLCESGVVRRRRARGPDPTDRIDGVLLHSPWGWGVLAAVMAALFVSIFAIAEPPMGWLEDLAGGLGGVARGAMPAGGLRDLLVDGVLAGVGGVVVFLPQILILFFFIGLLESTGYMARAAFIMDRWMNRVGLSGRSFIPLLGSCACAIPGIMAARTIEEPRDRLTTILVAPLMSCSARLPVYLLLIATVFPSERVPAWQKAGLMVLMYGLGTAGAFGFAWLFRRTLLRGLPPLMIMELPPYRMPAWGAVAVQMLERAWDFLRNAGTIILGVSIVLWFLSAWPRAPEGTPPAQRIEHSMAGRLGHLIEPVIEPLGFNWQIGLGLVTSFAAREVFVSSMAVVTAGEADGEGGSRPLRDGLLAARWPDGRPVFTPLVCVSLMVFYVFAMQCASTLAVVRRETHSWKWPLFQAACMTGTAWAVSFAVFQGGRLLGWA
jgi:ferrous iron transport protein B